MRSLPKPTIKVEDVFIKTISKVKDKSLKRRLEKCLPEIIIDSNEFDLKASNAKLHEIAEKSHVNGDITKDEMIKVYDGRLAKKDSPGREFYMTLRYPKGIDKCPLCGQLPIKTLDHYLAKTKHPSLAISPNNLVPACSDCNKIKGSVNPINSEQETLHPYFDNIDGDQWLFAEVIHTDPVSLIFYIRSPDNATQLMEKRVKYHFELYELNSLYSSEAASEISDISYQIGRLFDLGGAEAVRLHLTETADSCLSSRKNSWKSAMYQALAADSWYCSQRTSS
ncbi:hypothetical protein [Paenibacillus sp. FSL R5-0486]|uniref:HNH endonuclease n=1 Tax=Paenibacillus sp. FSL R5-0486 TaxID=2921645 RepID=UPI0030D6F1DD